MEITKNTRLKDIYKTASGHDIIARLFYSIGIDEDVLANSFIMNLKLKHLKTLSFNKFDDEATDSLIYLLNSMNFSQDEKETKIKEEWYKSAIFYQIYPRSFLDTNGDGIGDLNGIILKLDYLKELGVDALWICPFYDSPNADNGYDIRDYRLIMKEFGTNDDVYTLFDEAHKRGIKVIIDLVMNHSSDEHIWFKKALEGDKEYQDYYILKNPKENGEMPNNWVSMFSGSAWKYFKEIDKYALHLFAQKQIDLNWDNPKLRQEMFDIANFWLDKGADGFRLDVVSMISKDPSFKDGNELIGKLVGFKGIEHYFHGPHLDEYLKEFNEKCLKPHNAYTVGECPGAGLMMSRFIAGDDRDELSQLFSFDHMDNPGHKRYDIYDFDLRPMVKELVRWQERYSNHCWPTVFFNNHDNPRMNSKIDHEGKYLEKISKLLVLMQMSLKGTPYIYQGDEIGMSNYPFKSIDEFKDIEALNYFKDEININHSDYNYCLKRLKYGTRDNSRTPMQWNSEINGGFSKATPWINVNPNYTYINVEKQFNDKNSILNFYKKMIALRKNNKVLVYGNFKKIKTPKDIFMYQREHDGEIFIILINLTAKTIKKKPQVSKADVIISNYLDNNSSLRPYEAIMYKKRD